MYLDCQTIVQSVVGFGQLPHYGWILDSNAQHSDLMTAKVGENYCISGDAPHWWTWGEGDYSAPLTYEFSGSGSFEFRYYNCRLISQSHYENEGIITNYKQIQIPYLL